MILTCMYCRLFVIPCRKISLYSVVGPSYFVVKFSVDDTISMIPRRNIVGTTVPSLDDCCEVKWSNGEVLMATVLAAGKCVQVIFECTCIFMYWYNESTKVQKPLRMIQSVICSLTNI